MSEDKRLSFRKRILKRAKFSFNNEFCASECVIRNISETGALVEFADGILAPDHFKLHNEMDGYNIDCEIVRRVGNAAGVRFTGPREPTLPVRKQVITIPRRKNYPDPRQTEVDLAASTKTPAVDTAVSTYGKRPIAFGKR